MPRTLNAEMVAISPAKDAVIHGAGLVRILEGRSSFSLDEREMRRLVVAWLAYDADRLERDVLEHVRELMQPKKGPPRRNG